jgi:hypothetical protein
MFTVALWIVLALLRRIVVVSAFLVPLAGVTTFVAIDACSRHMKWAVIGPVLLPLLVASLAMVARFAKLRTACPGDGFSFAVCSSVAVLSLVLLVTAAM